MAARDYWDFIHETQAVFGFDISQARDYYHEFKEAFTNGEPATLDDLIEWADLAADLADDYLLAEEEEEEEPEYDDDPWIDEGEELEVTADLTYEER